MGVVCFLNSVFFFVVIDVKGVGKDCLVCIYDIVGYCVEMILGIKVLL